MGNWLHGKKEEQIQKCRSEELDLLNEKFCSLEDEITMVDDFSADLFNRSPEDDDFSKYVLALAAIGQFVR